MGMSATQIRAGMVILHQGRPHRVVSKMHITPGNWRAMVQTELKSLETGSVVNYRFRAVDDVEQAHLDAHDLQYLYRSGDDFSFMNTETYEMMNISADTLGENAKYLQENMVINAQYWEGSVVGIEVPMTVVFRIAETDPPMRGATASGGPKPAKLENGLVVKVPQHLSVGDLVKVDTRDDSFVERVQE